MKLCNKLWMATLCAFAAIATLPAQNSVDLDAQRKESQKICVIPGEKLDHQGIVINPTPQLKDAAGTTPHRRASSVI